MTSSQFSRVRSAGLLAAALLLPLSVAADTLRWPGIMVEGLPFQRPTEDGSALADQGPVFYQAASIFVDQTGVYTIDSDQRVFPAESEWWDGFLILYAAPFDPQRPLRNLIAANDDGPEGFATSQITAHLVAGVVYRVVTTQAQPRGAVFDNFQNTVTGPGKVLRSACFPVGDEFTHFDDESEISLLDELYCTFVSFRDAQGGEGLGRPVPHRSNESALFWFYDPDNWEVQVKVLDACAVNGHRWVFIAGTTNVELEIEVLESRTLRRRTYRNDLGDPTRSILDTAAFSCDEAPQPPRL